MREILFRGKEKKTGEWVYGYYYSHEFVREGETKPYYTDHRIKTIGRNREYVTIKVDPKTVGQWTGLKDKNGNKIFEGDIIKFVRYAVVTWHEVLGGFVLFFHPQDPFGSNIRWMLFNIGICPYEVIGNRFDNPELLDLLDKSVETPE